MEHDACILLLLNHGRLNRIFEQASVAYCPRPEPGSEASKEAARKRKNDAVAGPVGKQTKVPDKKKVDAPKASMTSKTAGVASSKADFAPTRVVVLKPGVHGCGESCFPCSSSCTESWGAYNKHRGEKTRERGAIDGALKEMNEGCQIYVFYSRLRSQGCGSFTARG
jgi:hypothetical protein